MNTSFPVMPLVILLLLVLPFKLAPKYLIKLAFFLWMLGGVVLMMMGVVALQDPSVQVAPLVMLAATVVALVVGFGKGRFVLSKTSQRNIDRIGQMQEPQRPIHVYSVRSWVIITLMVLISLSLTWFEAPWEWRGWVRLAVGFALVMSSLNYLKAPRLSMAPKA